MTDNPPGHAQQPGDAQQHVHTNHTDPSERPEQPAGPRHDQPPGTAAAGPTGAAAHIAAQATDKTAPRHQTAPPADEVDRIVAAWRAQRPDLDVSPLEVLSRISRLARHLDLARRTAFAAHGLESWGFDVLTALRRSGSPYQLTPGQLVTQTLVTSGTMTNRIDRLERAGLVSRQPDPSDRRGTLVTLTTDGRHRVDRALEDLLHAEQHLLDTLDDNQSQAMASLLRQLMMQFEDH